ncbi:Golgi reassembly-stacking protein 2 [Hypsibius exemplaris]|uniref:Golgi reassembly-stacking protein 2 n=1 Tax=Hypsibius exemplaris TaxID=2072580 RepID=A0A1W0WV61_HYPEX|nr:Golgi reassembly-stacking protein 2 [Hypsibius exemplaris]
MGNSQSAEGPAGGPVGYHVLKVQDNSPGSKAGLEPFFDFIITINGQRLLQDDDVFRNTLKTNLDRPVELELYNAKHQGSRKVILIPSTSWGGQGLLGVSIRFCSFEGANQNVWHVLDVHPGSPASAAQLRPYSDYLIGADTLLKESEDLYAVIEAHEGKPLKLYVYNTDTDSCREVTIVPNRNWGGEGSLGCDIGFGYLHRIPYHLSKKGAGDQADSTNPLLSSKSACSHDHGPNGHSHDHGHDHSHHHDDHSHGHSHGEHVHGAGCSHDHAAPPIQEKQKEAEHVHGAGCSHGHSHDAAPATVTPTVVRAAQEAHDHEHVHGAGCNHGHSHDAPSTTVTSTTVHSHDHSHAGGSCSGHDHSHEGHSHGHSHATSPTTSLPGSVGSASLGFATAPVSWTSVPGFPSPSSTGAVVHPPPPPMYTPTAAPVSHQSSNFPAGTGFTNHSLPHQPNPPAPYQATYQPPISMHTPPPPQQQFYPQYRPTVTSFPVAVSGFPPITVTSTLPETQILTNSVLSAFEVPPTSAAVPPYFYQPAQNIAATAYTYQAPAPPSSQPPTGPQQTF